MLGGLDPWKMFTCTTLSTKPDQHRGHLQTQKGMFHLSDLWGPRHWNCLSYLCVDIFCVQFSDDSRWWVEVGSGQVRFCRLSGELKQAVSNSSVGHVCEFLTANMWCLLPERTNGIKYPDSVRHTRKHTLIPQGNRLMGIWRMFLSSFTCKERDVL